MKIYIQGVNGFPAQDWCVSAYMGFRAKGGEIKLYEDIKYVPTSRDILLVGPIDDTIAYFKRLGFTNIPTALNIPAELKRGKVDAGETPEEALVREVFEETGLKVTSFEKIFTRIDGMFICYTYLCQADGEISNQNEVGKDSGIGKVAEVTWDDLFAGPFGSYNKQLYAHLNSK